MRKVLIITLYGNNNFGNKLQNYALQECIKDLGFICETLRIKYTYRDFYSNMKSLAALCIGTVRMSRADRQKYSCFERFNKEMLHYTEQRCGTNARNVSEITGYDFYVYGSDQIWNPTCFGDSDLFMGKMTDYNKNISYAASFGITDLEGEKRKIYREGLKNFRRISIREDAGKVLAESMGAENVEVVLDPTLLIDQSKWEEIACKPSEFPEKKYLLCCFLSKPEKDAVNEIEKTAEDFDYEILDIMDDGGKYYPCGPREFLYYIKHAQVIYTDSFHACVFSFLFDRPFVVFQRTQVEDMFSRMESLLNLLCLQDRKYRKNHLQEAMQHNYRKGYQVLEEKRNSSLTFLKKSLDIKGR